MSADQIAEGDFLHPGDTLVDAVRTVRESRFQLALVLSPEGGLVGTISDGDIRRALLSGLDLTSPVEDFMNRAPAVYSGGDLLIDDPRRLHQIQFLPVLDAFGRVTSMATNTSPSEKQRSPVLLMAGGRGTRLLPHTLTRPKPLVEVGGRPLIQILIEQFAASGFVRFFVSVNHMADQIVDFLGTGERFGVTVEYISESQPMGTAGSIGLIRAPLDLLLVANADVLTNCDFGALEDFHVSSSSDFTIGLRGHQTQIPFGVVDLSEGSVVGIREKPVIQSQVSAGIYALGRKALDSIPRGEYLDMPELIQYLVSSPECQVTGFPIHESWDDIGRPEDLEKARMQFSQEQVSHLRREG